MEYDFLRWLHLTATIVDSSSDRHRHRHDDVFGGCEFPFVILKGRNRDRGFSRVRAMYGLAVMPQSLRGESFRVAAGAGTFRLGVAVAA
jgi:hypothetical protein